MALTERNGAGGDADFTLSEQQIEASWEELLLRLRHRPGEATAAWNDLGQKYKELADSA